MALSQSYRPFTRRSSSLSQDSIDSASPADREAQSSSQEQWVLFSPQRNSILDIRSASSEGTPSITEKSQQNELESTSFIAGGYRKDARKKTYNLLDDPSTRTTDASRSSALEDEKLDSLDLHLHAFRDTAFQQSASTEYNQTALLPAHDGLGSFLVFGSYEQEQRRSSEHLAQPRLGPLSNVHSDQQDGEREMEMARIARIHAWRMEQSVLRQRDHRGSGTRRFSVNRRTRSQVQGGPTFKNERQQPISTLCDATSTADLSRLPDYGAPIDSFEENSTIHLVGWLDRLLDRIAHELEICANHLTEHPSAFTTYSRCGETTFPWQQASMSAQIASNRKGRLSDLRHNSHQRNSSTAHSSVIFRPTVSARRKNSGSRDSEQVQTGSNPSAAPLRTQSRAMVTEELWSELDYWERKLDFAAVVSFVYDRFFLGRYSTASRRPSAASALEHHSDPSTFRPLDCAQPTAAAVAATAARAATIWQNHPLLPPMPTSMNSNSFDSHLQLEQQHH